MLFEWLFEQFPDSSNCIFFNLMGKCIIYMYNNFFVKGNYFLLT